MLFEFGPQVESLEFHVWKFLARAVPRLMPKGNLSIIKILIGEIYVASWSVFTGKRV